MNIHIIGTGNMAWFLATGLKAGGHTIAGICGRDKKETEKLATRVSAKAYSKPKELTDEADCCIIAVSDNAIEGIANELAFRKTVLLHTAGSVQMNILSNAAPDRGVIWPIYSITKDDLPNHRSVPFAWEASSERAKEVLLELADSLSSITYEAGTQQRQALHLTAVMSNNFINHLMAVCEQICTENNMPFKLLQPILQQTFSRGANGNMNEYQTGPARRGDEKTIHQHLQLLQAHPHFRNVYEAMTASIKAMN